MKRARTLILLFFGTFLLGACNFQSQGFNLPEGSVESGKATFILLQCNDCHSVDDVAWNGAASEGEIHVKLGGETTHVKTYGDLVTSIINPSHKMSRLHDPSTMTDSGESKMRSYNEVMSVQELIDMVAFLQSKYEVWVPDHYKYK
ncbi:MAG TPA: cytochrome C [Gammaproteobacteria bacterium]|nr:cytochrome C [Gammaproteobacteria bacterium]HIL95678.1 cytochrome C [Pseudomonadales bacterium]